MQRHNFGRGEYKYLSYPLPEPVASLRTIALSALAAIANAWRETLGEEGQFPPTLEAFLDECHAAGTDPADSAAAALRRRDYNCLHQDLYGQLVFPLQLTLLLSAPGDGFHRRRVRAGGAAPARAVTRRGRPAVRRRGGDLPDASSPGAGTRGAIA